MPAWRNATAALSVMPRMAERAASGDFRRVRRAAVMVMHARCCYPSLAKVIISEYYLVLIPSANHPFCLPCAQLQDRQNPRLSIAIRASLQATCRWLDPSIGLIRDEPLMPVACFSSKSINLLTAYHDAYSSLIWEISKERVDSSLGEKQAMRVGLD